MRNSKGQRNTWHIFWIAAATAAVLNPMALRKWVTDPGFLPGAETGQALVQLVEAAGKPWQAELPAQAVRRKFVEFRNQYQFTAFLGDAAGRCTQPQPLLPFSPLLGGPALEPASRAPASVQPAAPRKMLFVGDSMLKTALAPVIQDLFDREQPDSSVDVFARSATGLARPDFFDWQAKARELAAKDRYDAVVVVLGTNDAQGIQLGSKSLRFGSPEWQAAYQERVREMSKTFCASAQRVYWIGVLPMREATFNSHITSLNQVIAGAMDACARYVSAPPALANPEGAFGGYLTIRSEKVRVREKDGIHLSLEGAAIFAHFLKDGLSKGFP